MGPDGLFSFAPIEETTQEEVQTKGKIYYLYNLGEVIHVEQHLYRLKNEFFHFVTTTGPVGRGNAKTGRGTGHS